MAITAFTLLAVIGLMPSALDSLRRAEHTAAEAAILQSIVSRLEATAQTSTAGTGTPPADSLDVSFYDASGTPQTGAFGAVYIAKVEPERAPLRLPGGSDLADYLTRWRITINDIPSQPSLLNKGVEDARNHIHSLVLVKREPDQ